MSGERTSAKSRESILLKAIDELQNAKSMALSIQMASSDLEDENDRRAFSWLGNSLDEKIEEVIGLVLDARGTEGVAS